MILETASHPTSINVIRTLAHFEDADARATPLITLPRESFGAPLSSSIPKAPLHAVGHPPTAGEIR